MERSGIGNAGAAARRLARDGADLGAALATILSGGEAIAVAEAAVSWPWPRRRCASCCAATSANSFLEDESIATAAAILARNIIYPRHFAVCAIGAPPAHCDRHAPRLSLRPPPPPFSRPPFSPALDGPSTCAQGHEKDDLFVGARGDGKVTPVDKGPFRDH